MKGRRTQFRRPLSFFFIPKGSKALPPLFQPRCCGSPALRPCLPPGGVSAAFRRFSRTRPAAFQDNGPVGRQRYEKAGSCTTRPPKSAESRLPGEEAGRLRRREKRRTRQRTVSACGGAPAPARGRNAVRPARTGDIAILRTFRAGLSVLRPALPSLRIRPAAGRRTPWHPSPRTRRSRACGRYGGTRQAYDGHHARRAC